ncbi:MCE family protein [Actinomadura sp. 9N407]|uniref:MCE family protein n=1 Tax=Actinomadura sp. 9N407 TaxID=3375154 RepID=UPI0037892299
MILTRGIRIRLAILAVLTAAGLAHTSISVLGVGRGLVVERYRAYVDLAGSGGLFTNAEVTYRGVTVGRVGPLRLTADGVRARLDLERGPAIPADTLAVVANRSAVGEQYIDLRPRRGGGPFLAEGSVIARADTRLPVPTVALLRNADRLLRSVNTRDLGIVIDELDRAFAGTGPELGRILDATGELVQAAERGHRDTALLIESGRTVLDTQVRSGDAIRGFARDLSALAGEIRRSDPYLRGTLRHAIPASVEASDAVRRLSPTLPVLLANLTTAGQVVTTRLPGVRQLLITAPLLVGDLSTVLPGDGTLHVGLALNVNAPPACRTGYEKAVARYPQDITPIPAELEAACAETEDPAIAVRGSRHVPEPDPAPRLPPGATEGAGTTPARTFLAGYDPDSRLFAGPDGRRHRLGRTGGQPPMTGDAAWHWLLLGPLAG